MQRTDSTKANNTGSRTAQVFVAHRLLTARCSAYQHYVQVHTRSLQDASDATRSLYICHQQRRAAPLPPAEGRGLRRPAPPSRPAGCMPVEVHALQRPAAIHNPRAVRTSRADRQQSAVLPIQSLRAQWLLVVLSLLRWAVRTPCKGCGLHQCRCLGPAQRSLHALLGSHQQISLQ